MESKAYEKGMEHDDVLRAMCDELMEDPKFREFDGLMAKIYGPSLKRSLDVPDVMSVLLEKKDEPDT